MVACLPSICKALDSIPSSGKIKDKNVAKGCVFCCVQCNFSIALRLSPIGHSPHSD